MLSLQNHRRLTQLFAVASVALVPEREDDEIHSDFDGYGDDPAKTFTQAPQNGLILPGRSEELTSELQSLMRLSYAAFRLKKKIQPFSHLPHPLHLHSTLLTQH